MVDSLSFRFSSSKYGKRGPQFWEGIGWYINVVEGSDLDVDIHLGATPGYEAESYIMVELSTSTYVERTRNIDSSRSTSTQTFKMNFKEELFLCSDTFYDENNRYNCKKLTVTVYFHSIRKYKDYSFQCDPPASISKYHSIPEEEEVQVKNGSEYVKFPNCEFDDPSFKKSDLVILIGDFHLFCHSLILSLNSPLFSDKIDQSMEENKKKEGKYVLELSDIDNIVDFQSFLYLIYNPRYSPRAQNVENILNYADRFQVDIVKDACEDFFLNKTHSFPVETLFAIAWRYNLQELKEPLDGRMTRLKFQNVFNSEHYQEASDAAKHKMCELSLLKLSLH